jgi:CubicO group peptidase (beta-lactamase class C family)
MRPSLRVPRPRLPRLPLLPDPFRRVRVPDDLESVTTVRHEAEVNPRGVGMTRAAVDEIWNAVRQVYRSGMHPAIALCLRREGEVVLDRAIGHARGNGPSDPRGAPPVPATPDTPFCIFSASKAITAMVAHLLDERRQIHVGDRVCEYIPEYGTHGKDAITIAHVLSHRAGVPNLPREALDLERAGDREHLLEILCQAKPRTRPGRLLAYHAIAGGYIIGEIVQRVTGKSIRDVLGQEILDPLGLSWTNYGVDPEDVPAVARSYVTGPPVLPPASTLLARALGLPLEQITEVSNDPRFLTAVVPAGNVVTTAEELSRFFEMLRAGGELGGVRIFEPSTIRRAITEQSYLEVDLTLGAPLRYSLGFMLGAKRLSLYGPDTEMAFGHLGFTNMLGWADPERALAGALLTSGKPVLYPELAELYGVMRRIGANAPKVRRSALAFEPAVGPKAPRRRRQPAARRQAVARAGRRH